MFVSVHKSTQDCFRNAEDEIQGGFWDYQWFKEGRFQKSSSGILAHFKEFQNHFRERFTVLFRLFKGFRECFRNVLGDSGCCIWFKRRLRSVQDV